MSTLLDTFQNMSSLDEMKEVKNKSYYDMSAVKGSTFLDIGSGFGKPVFHSAIQTGCESIGIEIVPARVLFCQDQKYEFEDYYKKKISPVEPANRI
jgi:cyclopropane fatty-acyl-phospholipid synthase-like methyltransferase